MTRVLLYSDEPILAKGLESVLRQIEGFELLPTSNSLASLMEQITQDAPDLVLMDLTAEITFAVLSDMKHAMSRSRIVLWVNSISTELAFQAMGLGVRGILRKTLPTELQVKCLQKVQAGELWFEKALTDSFLCARRVALTQREGQLVSLLSQGLKNKEIATTLMISEGTVKVYLSRLFQKVGVKDRFELALFGLKNLTTGQLPVGEKGQLGGEGEAQPVHLRESREDPPGEERAGCRHHCHARQANPPAIAPHQYGERHRDVEQRGSRKGEHQGREEHRAAGGQGFARHGRFLARAGERHGNHHQEEGAEVAQRAGLIEKALGAAVDAGIEPDELRPVAGGRRELEIEIDAGEERGGGRRPIEQASAAHGVGLPARAIGAIEEDVNRDGEEQYTRRAGRRRSPARIDRGGRQAGQEDAEEGHECGV